MNNFLKFLEWEGLQSKIEVTPINQCETLPPGIQKIEFFRDENYRIEVKIYSRFYHRYEEDVWMKRWNTRINEGGVYVLPTISFIAGELIVKLSNCLFKRSCGSFLDVSNDTSEYIFEFSAYSIFIERTPNSTGTTEEEWLTEWYLNGFESNSSECFYSRGTTRKTEEKYIRSRHFSRSDTFDIITGENSQYFDNCLVELENISFLIHAVPKSLTPSWSRGLGIEYRKEWGGIPDSTTRKKIAEIVSYIGGRKLINIGYTKFFKSGMPIEEFYVNPKSYSITYLNKLPEQPPIRLKSFDGKVIALRTEKILQEIVPAYLALRDSLRLGELLERYWIFQELPIGNSIPTLIAGIETLATDYLKSNNISLKIEYMPKAEFNEILKTEIQLIEDKLKSHPNRDKILEKIRGAYTTYIGINAKTKLFLSHINLVINPLEEKAIQQRNKMIHDSIDLSDIHKELEVLHLTLVCETFFNRIFLKVIGFEGKYIDYSIPENIERSLDQPTGD